MQEYIREISLAQVVKTIKINAKILLIITFIILLIAIILNMGLNRVENKTYYTTGAIQINNYAPNSFLDQQLVLSDNNKPMDTNNYGLASRSEVEEALIKTGYILIPVIKKNHLDIKITLVQLPIIKHVFKAFCTPDNENSNLMFRYCQPWFNAINITSFEVGPTYLNKNFLLKVGKTNTYDLYYNSRHILSGVVGKMASANNVSLLVNFINYPKGGKLILSKLSIDEAISAISQQIIIDPVVVGKNFVPPNTGILKISMYGDNPKLQARLINDIIDQLKLTALEQQGTALRSSIIFIEKQIATVSGQLTNNQGGMVKFQSSNNVISLDNQEREYIQQLGTTEQSILENKIAINQFSTLYASKHPIMTDLYTQRDFLAGKKATLDAQLKKIPKDEAVYLNLKRNLDVYQQLYSFLLNKEQDLKMKLSSLSSPVEILYYATPDVAASTDNITAKFIAATLIIIIAVFLLAFFKLVFFGNTDPWLMSQLSQIPLLTIFPYERTPRELNHSLELTASYLLNNAVGNKITVVNVGNISSQSGKSFIINATINYLTKLNKKCLHINFSLDNNLPTIRLIIVQLKQSNETMLDKVTELKINALSAINNTQLIELLNFLPGFDFIFIESPSTEKSVLFLNLAKVINQNIMITSPKDNRNKLEWLINDLNNLSVTIKQIIYNTPKKALFKSPFSVTSYNQ